MSQDLHDPDRSSGRDSIESITDSWSSDDRTILDSSPRRRISSSTSVFPFRFANGDIWSTGTSIFLNTTQFVVGAVGMKYLRIVRPNKLRRSVTAWGVLCGSQTIGGTVAYKAENKFNRDRKNPGDFDADSQKYCKEVLEKSDSIIWERLWKERSMPLFLTWSSKIWSSQDARVFNVGIPVFALNSRGIKTNFRYTDLGISATHFANAEQFTKRVYTLWLPSAAIMYISFFCQLCCGDGYGLAISKPNDTWIGPYRGEGRDSGMVTPSGRSIRLNSKPFVLQCIPSRNALKSSLNRHRLNVCIFLGSSHTLPAKVAVSGCVFIDILNRCSTDG
ncbi:hypothetical protein ABKN59_009523 [Abortiporus biennis]